MKRMKANYVIYLVIVLIASFFPRFAMTAAHGAGDLVTANDGSDASLDSAQLSADFFNAFKRVGDLKNPAIRNYFSRFPQQIQAFRGYTNSLVNAALVSESEADRMIEVAAASGLTQSSSNERSLLKRPANTTPNAAGNDQNQGTANDQVIQAKTANSVLMRQSSEVVGLPDGVLSEVVSGYLGNEGKPELLEFGVVPELPGADRDSAAAAIKTLEQHERRRKLAITATKIMRAFAANNVPRSEVGKKIAQIMQSEVEQKVTTEVNEVVNEAVDQVTERFFDSGRASVDAFTSRGPSYEVSGLKSFESSDADPVFTFGQIGARYGDSEATLNLGVGVRAIDPTQMGYGRRQRFS